VVGRPGEHRRGAVLALGGERADEQRHAGFGAPQPREQLGRGRREVRAEDQDVAGLRGEPLHERVEGQRVGERELDVVFRAERLGELRGHRAVTSEQEDPDGLALEARGGLPAFHGR
jgi:hypothetical protein